MSRKRIKKVSNEPTEYIPESHREYDRNAEKMEDRPLIFVGRKVNRDEQWEIREMLELKDMDSPEKGVRGMGAAYKYMWENLILEVKNVMAEDGDHESVTGEAKNALWYCEEIAEEVTEAITHFYTGGSFTEEEVKT